MTQKRTSFILSVICFGLIANTGNMQAHVFTGHTLDTKPKIAAVSLVALAFARMSMKSENDSKLLELRMKLEDKKISSVEYAQLVACMVWDVIDNKLIGSPGSKAGLTVDGSSVTYNVKKVAPYGVMGTSYAMLTAVFGKLKPLKEGLDSVGGIMTQLGLKA